MRPSPPILQCLRSQCLLSRFSSHTIHNRWIYQARLLDQIDVSFAEIGWYSTIAPNAIAVPLKGIPNRLLYGVSHQTKDLECFADSPWNSPTIRCPDRAAKAPQTSVLSLCAPLFLKSHLILICVVLTYNGSRKIPHKTCQIPRKYCQCEWLLVSSSTPRTSSSSSGSPGKFLFYMSRVVNHWNAKSCTSSAYRWLLRDSLHFLHWDLCDPQLSNHQMFRFGHVFCKKLPLFLSSNRCRNRHNAYPNPVPLSLATPLVIHVSRGSEGLTSSTKFSLKSSNQSGKSCKRTICTSSRPSFLFLFSVSVGLCRGFPRSSSLVLPLLSGTGFSMYLLTSNTDSCDEDDDDVGVA